jgi:hypothetical protein
MSAHGRGLGMAMAAGEARRVVHRNPAGVSITAGASDHGEVVAP